MTASVAPLRRAYVLGLLTLVYSLNIADRFVVSTLLEPLRLDLGLNDATVAFITGTALALFYVSVGLPVARYADRANRRSLIAMALAAWSVMTALCGAAQQAWQFVLARFGVGIGEAGGTPPSTSLIADLYPPAQRPAVYTVYALGAPLGAWFGASLAGRLADAYGWRWTFVLLGIPGVLVAAIVRLTVREPVRTIAGDHAGALPGMRDTLRSLRERRAAFHLIGAGSVATLWGWGLMWWTPTYLMRAYGLSVAQAGELLGPMHLVGGAGATVATYVAVQAMAGRGSRAVVLLMAGVLLAATVPSVFLYTTHSLATARALLWVVVPAVYFFIGPTFGLLQNVVPAPMRAQSVAVLLFVANVFNLVIAPEFVGLLSDALAGTLGSQAQSLRVALLVLAPTGLWAVWHYLRSLRTLAADEIAASA